MLPLFLFSWRVSFRQIHGVGLFLSCRVPVRRRKNVVDCDPDHQRDVVNLIGIRTTGLLLLDDGWKRKKSFFRSRKKRDRGEGDRALHVSLGPSDQNVVVLLLLFIGRLCFLFRPSLLLFCLCLSSPGCHLHPDALLRHSSGSLSCRLLSNSFMRSLQAFFSPSSHSVRFFPRRSGPHVMHDISRVLFRLLSSRIFRKHGI